MMRVKEIYFKNTVYKVPIDDLKHVNGFDVVKLPNQTFVYYDDFEKKWKIAPETLIEEYAGKKYIDVEFNGDIIKCLSYIDLEEDIYSKKLTKINIECVVTRDETSKIWKIIDKNNPLYQIYTQEKTE